MLSNTVNFNSHFETLGYIATGHTYLRQTQNKTNGSSTKPFGINIHLHNGTKLSTHIIIHETIPMPNGAKESLASVLMIFVDRLFFLYRANPGLFLFIFVFFHIIQFNKLMQA